MLNIFWFRRDLRLHDNTGLSEALSVGTPVVPIFIFDTDILEQLADRDDSRVTFIHETLERLQQELIAHGSSLQIFYGKPSEVFRKILSGREVKAVYSNHDYEPYAIDRDLEIQQLCLQSGAEFRSFKDQVIFEKLEVVKDDGKPYTVFTPYKNKWKKLFEKELLRPRKVNLKNLAKMKPRRILSLKEIGFEKSKIQVPDFKPSSALLKQYAKERNFPAKHATSRVGVHLRFGTVSIREASAFAIKYSDTWLSELIWREFFMQILFNFPEVTERPAKSKYENIKWRNNKSDFKKWCEGKTGVAIVDAGMRELNETGFMHNRVRMIAASYLVKHLLIDYRWGEKYFARKLLDFELASNNGNWQWVAGTGCDAAPYFRIFNPLTQMKKFDPDGEYVRRWVPEFGSLAYADVIVDHEVARKRALAAYRASLT